MSEALERYSIGVERMREALRSKEILGAYKTSKDNFSNSRASRANRRLSSVNWVQVGGVYRIGGRTMYCSRSCVTNCSKGVFDRGQGFTV